MYAVKHDFFFKICTLWHHPEFTVRESLSLEVSPYLRKTAASSEAPLLLLQERSGLSPWLFGTLCGVALFAFMFSPALIVDLGDSERRDLLGVVQRGIPAACRAGEPGRRQARQHW